jgi:5'-3' exonuclease
MKLISEHAPKAVKEQQMENYFARKVAIDASMSLYQFLVSPRAELSRAQNAEQRTSQGVASRAALSRMC